MQKFLEIWNKDPKDISDEGLKEAARELYDIIAANSQAAGRDISMEPNYVCQFDIAVKKEEEDISFRDIINRSFKQETGKDWDSNKYVLVLVPPSNSRQYEICCV